jgi:thioredoxin 1
MSTVTLTKDTIDEVIGAEGITLVDWWAEWCGPCKQFGPVFEAASEQHSDVVFGKIDTEDQRELAAAAQITSIPTLMAFRDGILVFSQPVQQPDSSRSSPRSRTSTWTTFAVRSPPRRPTPPRPARPESGVDDCRAAGIDPRDAVGVRRRGEDPLGLGAALLEV